MKEEYGRCKCGSIRFQSSSALPNNNVVCGRCHMVWEVESGKIKVFKNTFTDEVLDIIVAGLDKINRAYSPEERAISLLDAMIIEVEQ